VALEPSLGRIVHYKLTHADATVINKQRVQARSHLIEHRESGAQISEGNQHRAGDVVPLIIVRVWPDEYSVDVPICRDYTAGTPDGDIEWSLPLSTYGVNGQGVLDGNDHLWITSAPQGEFNGSWNWPPLATGGVVNHVNLHTINESGQDVANAVIVAMKQAARRTSFVK
jgi:hypothetical protein